MDLVSRLARTQSFTEASKFLGISQSVASRKLSAFEDALGITIVDRSSRPIRLTSEGRKLLEACEPFLETVPPLLDALRTRNFIRRDLRLGVVDTFTRGIATSLLKSVKNQVTHCSVLSGTSDRLLTAFENDEIDVFISSDPALDVKEARKKFFYGEPSFLVYPKNSRVASQDVDWQSLLLCGLPFIGLTNGSGGAKLFESFLINHNIPIHPAYNVDNTCVLLDLVNEGMGWSITRPAGVLQHQEHLNNVAFAPMPKPILTRELYLVSKKNFPFELFQSLYTNLVLITREKLAKRTVLLAPWLRGEIYTSDLTSERKALYTESIE
jgi:DNA-binding transcriptional LysR family regulator